MSTQASDDASQPGSQHVKEGKDSDSDSRSKAPDADTNGSSSNQAPPRVNSERAAGGGRKRARRKQTTKASPFPNFHSNPYIYALFLYLMVDGPIDHTDETFEHGRVDWFSPFDLNGRRNNALLKSCVERLQALIKEQYPAFVPAFAGFTADKCKAYTDQMWVKRGGEEERGGGFGGGKALKRVPRLEMEIPEPTMHDGRRVTENGSPVLVRTPYEVKVSDFLHESYVTMTTGEIARHYSGADFAAEDAPATQDETQDVFDALKKGCDRSTNKLILFQDIKVDNMPKKPQAYYTWLKEECGQKMSQDEAKELAYGLAFQLVLARYSDTFSMMAMIDSPWLERYRGRGARFEKVVSYAKAGADLGAIAELSRSFVSDKGRKGRRTCDASGDGTWDGGRAWESNSSSIGGGGGGAHTHRMKKAKQSAPALDLEREKKKYYIDQLKLELEETTVIHSALQTVPSQEDVEAARARARAATEHHFDSLQERSPPPPPPLSPVSKVGWQTKGVRGGGKGKE